LLPITAERGYLIPAIGNEYVACAERLRDSILKFHLDANITIVTEDMLPNGNLGGYANDWQMFKISPYRQTIKLEADMICCSAIDHWWTLFEHRDVVVSQGCRTFYNEVSSARQYRKLFDVNDLPDVYNAITYWRLSETARDFFSLVRDIFSNWNKYKTLLKFPEDDPSTDVVYAIAAKVIGIEKVTLPNNVGPSIVHMKRYHQPIKTDNWTNELVWESDPVRIQTVAQWGMLHYHIKDWQL
jgi:hypothetical protein